jgi:hypothetical protein
MARTGWDGTLQKLIEAAKDVSLDPQQNEATRERISWMLGKQEIVIDVAGVRLSAWLSEKLWLTVSVSVTQGWNPEVEKEVYQSLKRSRRITALLVMAEWAEIRALCEKQGASCPHELN